MAAFSQESPEQLTANSGKSCLFTCLSETGACDPDEAQLATYLANGLRNQATDAGYMADRDGEESFFRHGNINKFGLKRLVRLHLYQARPEDPDDESIANMIQPLRTVAAVSIFFHGAMMSGQSSAPFQTLQFTVQIVEPAQAKALNGYWDPERGLEVMIVTPFYRGDLYAGGQFKSFSGTGPSYPDFKSVYPFLGWGGSIPLFFQARLHPGINLGIIRMEFETLSGFERTESEVGLTLLLEISRPLTPDLTLRSSIRRETIFTYERIHLLNFTAGLGYTIQTPPGIKKLLE